METVICNLNAAIEQVSLLRILHCTSWWSLPHAKESVWTHPLKPRKTCEPPNCDLMYANINWTQLLTSMLRHACIMDASYTADYGVFFLPLAMWVSTHVPNFHRTSNVLGDIKKSLWIGLWHTPKAKHGLYILYLAGFRKAKYNYIMDIGSLDYRGAVPATQTSQKNIAQIFQLNQPLLAEAPHYQPCVFAWKSHTDRQLSPWFWNTHSPPLPAAWQQACRGQLLSISCMLNCKHGVALCARVVRYPLHICLVLFFFAWN